MQPYSFMLGRLGQSMGHCSHGIVTYQPASRMAGAAGRPEALSAHTRSSAPASLPPRPGVYLIPWQWKPTFLQDAHGIIQVGGLEMVRRRGFQLRLRFQLVPASTLVCLLFGLPSRNLRLQRQTQEKQSHINCSQLPRLPKIKSLHLSFPLSHTHMHTHTQLSLFLSAEILYLPPMTSLARGGGGRDQRTQPLLLHEFNVLNRHRKSRAHLKNTL